MGHIEDISRGEEASLNIFCEIIKLFCMDNKLKFHIKHVLLIFPEITHGHANSLIVTQGIRPRRVSMTFCNITDTLMYIIHFYRYFV